MWLHREPINRSKQTNFKYLSVSQREHPGEKRKFIGSHNARFSCLIFCPNKSKEDDQNMLQARSK
jgi:hypothetical protein